MEGRHLQETDRQYKVFLYVFYACMVIMGSITFFGIYSMTQDWQEEGTYVMGEILVQTQVPFENFANLSTWLFFSSVLGWYCVSRIGWKKPAEFNKLEAREELIDIWHFLIQASLELELTPDDILKEYQRKNEINRQRQKDGY